MRMENIPLIVITLLPFAYVGFEIWNEERKMAKFYLRLRNRK
jgi:hypothetical protein